jgi:hypothetical protein
MRRINAMGLRAPRVWKDELYRHELKKLDVKRELRKLEGPGKPSIRGEIQDDLERMEASYFDRAGANTCQGVVRARTG